MYYVSTNCISPYLTYTLNLFWPAANVTTRHTFLKSLPVLDVYSCKVLKWILAQWVAFWHKNANHQHKPHTSLTCRQVTVVTCFRSHWLQLFLCRSRVFTVNVTKVNKGSRSVAALFHSHGTKSRWVLCITPWPLYSQGTTPVPTAQETGCTPEPVWEVFERRRIVSTTGIRTRPFHSLV